MNCDSCGCSLPQNFSRDTLIPKLLIGKTKQAALDNMVSRGISNITLICNLENIVVALHYDLPGTK